MSSSMEVLSRQQSSDVPTRLLGRWKCTHCMTEVLVSRSCGVIKEHRAPRAALDIDAIVVECPSCTVDRAFTRTGYPRSGEGQWGPSSKDAHGSTAWSVSDVSMLGIAILLLGIAILLLATSVLGV